jgi:hypothetical protein
MRDGRGGRGFRLKIHQRIANVNIKDFQPERRGEEILLFPSAPLLKTVQKEPRLT